jgi:cyclophilin family peptidyl-prolyl cis-trans isomerase
MSIHDLLAHLFRSSVVRRVPRLRLEQLEERTTPTAAINLSNATFGLPPSSTPLTFDVPTGLSQLVPLSLVTQPSTLVNYTATSTNSQITTQVLTSTEAWDLTVTGKDASGNTFTGDLIIQLFPNESPAAVQRIVQLTGEGFYNNLNFFRVISGFAAQAGDPNNNGTGGSSLPEFQDQFAADLSFNSPGMVAFANSGPDTNNSQFFISALNQPPVSLNFKYDIFGQLVSGFSTFNSLMSTPVGPNPENPTEMSKPLTNVVITNAKIIDDPGVAVLKISAASGFGFQGNATINVSADDGSGPSTASFDVDYQPVTAATYNNPPFLGTIANQTTYANTPVSFQIPATDIEHDTLTYAISAVVTDATNFGSNPPPNVTVSINQTTGVATVTPDANFTGTVDMLVGVRDQTVRNPNGVQSPTLDDQFQFDTHEVTLTVLANDNNGTQAPIINPITLPPVADGTTSTFTAYAVAPTLNGSTVPLTYSLGSGSPAFASIAQTGVVTLTPSNGNNQPPGTYTLTVQAAETNNPQLIGTQTFTITVGPTSTDQGSGITARTTVALGLTQSQEYYNNLVTAAYIKYLGRSPQPSELPFWVNQLLNHTLSDEQLEAGFLVSPEYIGDNGGNPVGATWVQSLYMNLLGRTGSQSDVQFWVNKLTTNSPEQVALDFTTSPERESDRVAADYQQYLGRSASTSEIQYWVNVFENGGSNEQVIAGFISSQEYFQDHGDNIVDWLYTAYQAVLNREAQSSELPFWENQLQ